MVRLNSRIRNREMCQLMSMNIPRKVQSLPAGGLFRPVETSHQLWVLVQSNFQMGYHLPFQEVLLAEPKEQLSQVEQQLKRVEVAQRCRIKKNEKAARESELSSSMREICQSFIHKCVHVQGF